MLAAGLGLAIVMLAFAGAAAGPLRVTAAAGVATSLGMAAVSWRAFSLPMTASFLIGSAAMLGALLL